MEFLASISGAQWVSISAAALFIGLAKAGLDGGAIIAVPLLALAFGAKASSGLLLGILMTADVVAVLTYRKQANFRHLLRLMPWALAGVVLGTVVGGAISEHVFRLLISVFILLSAALMGLRLWRGGDWVLPERWWAAGPLGILAGFTSMVGNAAGPVMGLYLISSGLDKRSIIGTSVVFFFSINIVKLPFNFFAWHTVSAGSVLADLAVAPIAVVATLLGVRLVRLIPDKAYKYFLVAASGVGGLYLLLR